MNELILKVRQTKQLNTLLRVVLADSVADVQVAALALAFADVVKTFALPVKIAFMHRLIAEIFGPESVESQLDRYIQELKDAKKSEEKAAPPSSGTV